MIELVYLHGRVARDAGVQGRLVFSENSYSENRERCERELRALLSSHGAFLAVGTSLSDDPLIQALTQTKGSFARGRVAVLTVSEPVLDLVTDQVAEDDLLDALGLRGTHLGLTMLYPANHHQIAQFIEEVRVMMILHRLDSMDTYAGEAGYGPRLWGWWLEWSKGDDSAPKSIYKRLRDGLVGLESLLHPVLEFRNDVARRMRLELWVRWQPSARENRTLTLVGTSSGPSNDVTNRRRETTATRRPSHIAAVRAFQEGKPVRASLSSLGFKPVASRWKTFLAVPIFVEREVTVREVEIVANLPVAVIVVATSGVEGAEDTREESVFYDGRLSKDDFARILEYLIGVGRMIVDPVP